MNCDVFSSLVIIVPNLCFLSLYFCVLTAGIYLHFLTCIDGFRCEVNRPTDEGLIMRGLS